MSKRSRKKHEANEANNRTPSPQKKKKIKKKKDAATAEKEQDQNLIVNDSQTAEGSAAIQDPVVNDPFEFDDGGRGKQDKTGQEDKDVPKFPSDDDQDNGEKVSKH